MVCYFDKYIDAYPLYIKVFLIGMINSSPCWLTSAELLMMKYAGKRTSTSNIGKGNSVAKHALLLMAEIWITSWYREYVFYQISEPSTVRIHSPENGNLNTMRPRRWDTPISWEYEMPRDAFWSFIATCDHIYVGITRNYKFSNRNIWFMYLYIFMYYIDIPWGNMTSRIYSKIMQKFLFFYYSTHKTRCWVWRMTTQRHLLADRRGLWKSFGSTGCPLLITTSLHWNSFP